MWISRKKFRELERRVADLEEQNRHIAVPIGIDGKEVAKAIQQAIHDNGEVNQER